MKLLDKMSHFEGFELSWKRLLVQSLITLISGGFIGLISALNHDVMILNVRGFSLLPIAGLILVVLGISECLDAFLTKSQREVVQNLQVGVFDLVIGMFTLLSISGNVSRIIMMISAFLIVRGIVRITYVFALKLPNTISTAFGGLLSVILGTLLYQEWPTAEAWFISMCLSIEIAFRGWAGMSFALWVRKHKLAN